MEKKQNQLGKNRSSGEEKVERIIEEKKESEEAKKPTGKRKNASETAKKPSAKRTSKKVAEEKSAAKKRVELALKKEELKAEKQKAKDERKKRNAESKEARRQKKAESREKRREKRLLLKEKREEAKRLRAQKKQERRDKKAERAEERKLLRLKRREAKEKRKTQRKAETKEARAKRLQKEKAAKIAERKEQKKRRYELRLQRRDAALKRKQRRLEEKQRRRSENHAPGFGGWLAAVISLGVVTLALGSVVTVGAVRMNEANTALATGYRGALYELTGTLSEVDDDLAKARVSSGGRAQSEVLTDLLVQSRLAERTLEKFPIDGETDVNMTAFLNRAGDTAQRFLGKIRSGETLSEKDYEALDRLYATNRKILEELIALESELTDKDVAAFMKNVAGNKVFEHFRNAENFAIEADVRPEGALPTEGGRAMENAVSLKEAEEACSKYFVEYGIDSVEYAGETVAENVAGYNFILKDREGRRLYAVIGKKDASLVGFDYHADCANRNFDFENALTLAENYVQFLGYESVIPVWASESGVNATFTFVYEEDGVAYYADALKVKVCEERGKVVGFTAAEYLKRHGAPRTKERKIVISADEAEKTLRGDLTVENVRKAAIFLDGRERVCYEFVCLKGDEEYFIYVDATTGEEVKIYRVLPTTQGRYLR